MEKQKNHQRQHQQCFGADSASLSRRAVMPRPRAMDPSPRQPQQDPPTVRTSNADPDPSSHHRSRTDNKSSPRLSEGRSPRGGVQSRPLDKKKLGTRIADLESQLGLAQEELRNLKDELITKTKPKRHNKAEEEEEEEEEEEGAKDTNSHAETDVFEVPLEPETGFSSATSDPEIPTEPETDSLKSNEKQLEALREENESLKTQLEEKSLNLSSAELEVDELKLKLSKKDQELATKENSLLHMNEKLQATEKAKVELEEEMRRLRVQMEQWKKAANAAASVVISERCGSIDKRYYSEPFNGDYDYVGSPREIIDEAYDDECGNGKKKGGSGIKMFGELWKKKVMK